MKFPDPLIAGRLIKRYKRFLADVELDDGPTVTVHCPNTGAMYGCDRPGSRVWLSRSDNPKRKYPLTWELVEAEGGALVGIHSARANAFVEEALATGSMPAFGQPASMRREVAIPPADGEAHRSRADFVLGWAGQDRECVVEVKSVTARDAPGRAFFPDAVSARAARHLELLERLVAGGSRAALVFCVQRGDIERLRAAEEIDPVYARALTRAREAGVECHAYGCTVSVEGITLTHAVKLDAVVV
jgi:sugar fermentation stimulation protein A